MLSAVLLNAVRSFAPLGDQWRLVKSCAALANFSSRVDLSSPEEENHEGWQSYQGCGTKSMQNVKGSTIPSAPSESKQGVFLLYGLRDQLCRRHLLDLSSAYNGNSMLPSEVRQFSRTGLTKDENERKTQTSAHSASGVIETAKPPAQEQGWLASYLPKAWLPYALLMRLDKPIGTWLLAWPCFWSIALATPQGSLPDLKMMGLFGAGALILRGAGCTVNDLWDQDLDKKVERTRDRPLASGALTTRQGLGLLAAQLLLGLGILVQLNSYSIFLGASSLALVFTYPLMKRITFWPQAFLGLTFNWGALLGYAAVRGVCDWPIVLPLYLGGICWTLVYDTIYAHQDKADDVSAGVKSTALLFGGQTRPWLSGFALGATSFWTASGLMADSGGLFLAGVSAAGCHMFWQIWTTNLDSRTECMNSFVSNKWLGSLLFSGIVLDKLL